MSREKRNPVWECGLKSQYQALRKTDQIPGIKFYKDWDKPPQPTKALNNGVGFFIVVDMQKLLGLWVNILQRYALTNKGACTLGLTGKKKSNIQTWPQTPILLRTQRLLWPWCLQFSTPNGVHVLVTPYSKQKRNSHVVTMDRLNLPCTWSLNHWQKHIIWWR